MELSLNAHLRSTMLCLLGLSTTTFIYAQQTAAKSVPDTTGRANSPFSRNEADLPKGPAPRLGSHPDLSGYWIPSKKDKPT